jgi:predicted CoA-binding protein
VQEALVALPGLKTVWMQLGVENADAAALAEARGLQVVQNRCPAIEFPRLGL